MIDYHRTVALERPLSEGDQLKATIREFFETKRQGVIYDLDNPLKRKISNVNGESSATLNIAPHESKKGAIVLWYE